MGCVQYWGDEIVEMTAYSGVLGMSMRMQRELQFRIKHIPPCFIFWGRVCSKNEGNVPENGMIALELEGEWEHRNSKCKNKLKGVQNLLVLSRE